MNNAIVKSFLPLMKNLSYSDKIKIATKGKISQELINKIIKGITENDIVKTTDNLKINGKLLQPEIIDKMKEMAAKITLDDINKNKVKLIAEKLNIPEGDIIEIERKMGTNASNDVSLEDINKILTNESVSELMKTPANTKKLKEIPSPIIGNTDIAEKIRDLNRTIKKTEKGYSITQEEKENYEKKLDELKNIDENDGDKDEVKKYLTNINDNIDIDNKITNKIIIDFSKYASLFRFCLIMIICICLFIYIIIVVLSFINVVYLLFKIIHSIINLFYNTVIPNHQTLSYNAKQIIKSTNNNYKYDIFNIIAEQKTSLTIFNTIIYIAYILMAYVILYLLCVIYAQIMRYTHIFKGSLSDIDSKYQILSIIGILFIFSLLHLLIYKFIYKNMALSNFKELNNFEKDVDMRLSNIIMTTYNNNDECLKFFELLADTSKRNELDSLFANKVKTIKTDNENNVRKYLMMYNIYMYFEEYLYIDDVMRDKIKKYFGMQTKPEKDVKPDEEVEEISFIGLLDSNERKLLKAYHEDLPFHKLISKDYIEDYQKITEDITSTISAVNKYIIKYTGTFFPFLITCIYIILICIYNIYTLYILCNFINGTESENLFITFIYTFSHKYIYYCEKIYLLFFNNRR